MSVKEREEREPFEEACDDESEPSDEADELIAADPIPPPPPPPPDIDRSCDSS